MDALAQNKNTTSRNDDTGHQTLRHLSESTYDSILRLFDEIWMDEIFLNREVSSVVQCYLKRDKPSTETGIYSLIALTSCSCKLLERVVNTEK